MTVKQSLVVDADVAMIPSAERRQIVAFLTWWSNDQSQQAETSLDYDKEIEFAIRAEALADAARDILDFGDARHASAIEARRAETAQTDSVHESAVGNAETPNLSEDHP